MTRSALLSLGLTEQEAAFYEALLPLGDASFADVAQATNLHPQIVTRLVERLAAKELATVTVRKHRKHVRAEDPRLLEQKAKRQLEELQRALPDLLALRSAPTDALVRVAAGDEAVRALRMRGMEELAEGGTYYVIGGSGDRFYEVMGERNAEVEKRRAAKKIQKKLVTFESQRKSLGKHERPGPLDEFRYLPERAAVPSSTNIFNDTVAIIVWSKNPVVIAIDSPEVAASYRDYFGALWRQAKG